MASSMFSTEADWSDDDDAHAEAASCSDDDMMEHADLEAKYMPYYMCLMDAWRLSGFDEHRKDCDECCCHDPRGPRQLDHRRADPCSVGGD